MRKIREILRLKLECRCSNHLIALSVGVSSSSVSECLRRKCFVDYAGMKVPIMVNQTTGEIKEAEIFVAALGASNYTYAEATWSQQLSDWISSHVRAFEFFGGIPEIVVPDNLKSGVAKSHRYEPDINPSYQDMAQHYGVAVIPTRVNAPQDKAKVENAVQQVERQILAKLRDQTFFSLQELNKAIVGYLNDKPVATSALFSYAGVAGIWDIITLPDARRKGIGTDMTLYASNEGKKQCFLIGVLTASDEGQFVYRKLGFEPVQEFAVYSLDS